MRRRLRTCRFPASGLLLNNTLSEPLTVWSFFFRNKQDDTLSTSYFYSTAFFHWDVASFWRSRHNNLFAKPDTYQIMFELAHANILKILFQSA